MLFKNRLTSGFAHLIVVILIVIIGIGALGYFAYKNGQVKISTETTSSSPTSQQNPSLSPTRIVVQKTTLTSDPTANWKTYNDSNNQFSFKYPANINKGGVGVVSGPFTGTSSIVESFSDPTTVREGTDAHFDGFTIYTVSNMKVSNFEKYIDNEIATMKASPFADTGKVLTKNALNLNGVKGYSVEFSSSTKYYYLLSEDEKVLIEISRIFTNQSFATTFDQILSTFKFLDDN